MKLNYEFSNLCGTVYNQGNLEFHKNLLYSPVGNRVSCYDLKNDKSSTLRFEARMDIKAIAISPSGNLLLTIDNEWKGLLVNIHSQAIIHRQTFDGPVQSCTFSPSGKLIAITSANKVQIWKLPSLTIDALEFAPLALLKVISGTFDIVNHVSWANDSRIVLGSSDLSVRICSIDDYSEKNVVLNGHRSSVLKVWFSVDQETVYSVSKDGSLFVWKLMIEDEESDDERDDEDQVEVNKKPKISGQRSWVLHQRHYFGQKSKVISADFHPLTNLLVVGFGNGVFGIWELPDFINIHSLSISQKKIDSVSISPSGEWLALGSSKLGQLLVWEWQSESYILKQQGHLHNMNCIAYSQDGQFIITGGDDGKVKLWNMQSGFCFVTFSEHTASVQAVECSKRGQTVFSASLDGTVRAYDLIRYRNFRTFTSPSYAPVQFTSIALDPSADIVCAGTQDTFDIYMWSIQTGALLSMLPTAHTGPLSSLIFSPIEGTLVSSSWDATVRVWKNVFNEPTPEELTHSTEVLALSFSPDGRKIASATLDGQITFWDIDLMKYVNNIDGKNDVGGGRLASQYITSETSSNNKHFNSLAFTSDGASILAGGNSKFVCIYDVVTCTLLKRFQITSNFSLDGIHEKLDSRNLTEAGPKDLIDDTGDLSDFEDRRDNRLPGATKGELGTFKKSLRQVRTRCVRFSPTGRSWAAASTEGLLIYSLDDAVMFDPFDLEIDIHPEGIYECIRERHEYLRALVMSFRLGENEIIENVMNEIPVSQITKTVKDLPFKYFGKLVKLLATRMEGNSHIEQNMIWVAEFLRHHGRYLKTHSVEFGSSLRGLLKNVTKTHKVLAKATNSNLFSMQFLAQRNEKVLEIE